MRPTPGSTERTSSGSSVPQATGIEVLHPLAIDESRWTADELAMIEGYVAAELAYVRADAIPDENEPSLATTTVDPILAQRRKVITAHRFAGQASRYPDPDVFIIRPERIEMIDAANARLWVCETANGDLYDVKSGGRISGETSSSRELIGMTRIEGAWLLAERVEQGRWEGVAGCAD